MKLGPLRLMKNVQFCVIFWTPTSHMAAASRCIEDLLVRNFPKKDISHGRHGAVYCILVYTQKFCCLTYTHSFYWCLLNHLVICWTLSSLLFFLCCLRSFLLHWKLGGEFWSCVSVCSKYLSLACVLSLSFLAALTSHLCVAINWNDMQASVVLQWA